MCLQDEMADICSRTNAVKCGKEMKKTETMRESERKREIKKERERERRKSDRNSEMK